MWRTTTAGAPTRSQLAVMKKQNHSVSRREFLASTIAVGTIACPHVQGAQQHEKIRIGQIGTKHPHASGKISAMRSLGDLFEVVGVVEPDEARRRAVAGTDAYRGLRSTGPLALTGPVNFAIEHANRGKRSVGIDLANPEGRALLGELAREADVFVTNLLPESRERLRLEVDDVREFNPDIIYARGTGLGERPERPNAGGDDSESGIGGTGVIGVFGTITRTDRLCVNGLEIQIPDQLSILESSGAISEQSLKVGNPLFEGVGVGFPVGFVGFSAADVVRNDGAVAVAERGDQVAVIEGPGRISVEHDERFSAAFVQVMEPVAV